MNAGSGPALIFATAARNADYVFTNAYGLRRDEPQETAYPATFVIDRRGVVRFAQISIGHDRRAVAADALKALSQPQLAQQVCWP